MCIACRDRSAKRALIRIVRTPEGSAEIDPSGKLNGRGAYLCDRRTCWEKALSGRLLADALKHEFSDLERLALRAQAERLQNEDPEEG